MPPPSLPSPSRRSSAAHTMMASSSESNVVSSSFFSMATKAETLRLTGAECWACSSSQPDICHVVPRCDPQIIVWEQAYLFAFDYKSTQNTIPLCGTCHNEFDLSLDPGYVFFPTDLQFFIDFEHRDRARREKIATDTTTPISSLPRQVPTSADYKQHEINSNQISPTAIGGRYNRVFLKQYLHHGRIPGIERIFSTPKEWHGAPIASIRRAFAALGSPRFFLIVDTSTRQKLEELRQLYFSDDYLSSEQVTLRDVYRPQAQTTQKHQLEEQTNSESGTNDKSGRDSKKAKHQDTGVSGSASVAIDKCREQECTNWVLGPESTTNDVVRLYAPVFAAYYK